MPEYQRHAFEKEWHDKVEKFIEENDLAFDSPKYFIKFCVNKYMDEYGSVSDSEIDSIKSKLEALSKLEEEE